MRTFSDFSRKDRPLGKHDFGHGDLLSKLGYRNINFSSQTSSPNRLCSFSEDFEQSPCLLNSVAGFLDILENNVVSL